MQSQEISVTPISGNPIAEIKSIHHDFAFFPHFHEFHSSHLFVNHVHSMRVISHEIEDGLSQAQSTGELFAGFQKLSHFLPHVKRYRALAKKGIKIWIFGIPDITPPTIDGLQYIYLTEKHALSNEWFVIANATEFFSALIVEELTDASPFSRPVAKKETLFRGYWTFDQTQIEDLLLQMKIELGFEDWVITKAAERNYEGHITALSISANNFVHQLEKRNEDLIRQRIFDNLLSNALKYEQVIELAEKWQNTGINVYIDDDGPGIPVYDREYIYEKYTRANLGNTQKKGTGLGLSFCKLAIEALGGRISIGDSPSGGASLQINIPINPPKAIKPPRKHRTHRIDSSQAKENQQ
jgi:DICT domain-containing protein